MAEINVNDVVDIVLANEQRFYEAVLKTKPGNNTIIWEALLQDGSKIQWSTNFIAIIKKP